ncbi:MAG: DUF5696 domain-containing protein [Candidatus Izemoplasmataceae bacterium]
MYLILKRFAIGLLFISIPTTAIAINNIQDTGVESTQNYVEDIALNSSRYAQPLSNESVDFEHYIELYDTDILTLENDQFALYVEEETYNIKVLNKNTNYVWSSTIEDAQAGTFSELLESFIGFEYINASQNYSVRENVGLSSTEHTIDMTVNDNTLRYDIFVGGFCATRNCSRLYDAYLDGRYTLEQMIEFGLTEINIHFALEITLTSEGIEARVPFESILEENAPNIQLSSLMIFPALGATYLDDINGYMIIPDGVGALIRYEDNENRAVSPYNERFYGDNMGVESTRQSLSSYNLNMPIFGAVHGHTHHAFLGRIIKGDASARLIAYPNGASNIPYNLIFAKYDFKQVYRQSFTTDGSGGALRVSEASNSDIHVRYDFLSDEEATYTGLALRYQAQLVQEGILERQMPVNQDIPVHLQFLLADSKERFIGNSLVLMSETDQVETMINRLNDRNIQRMRVSLLGWNDSGYSGYLPSEIDFENQVGRKEDFERLFDFIGKDNVMLVNNYLSTTDSNNRINMRTHVARGVNRFKLQYECGFCVHETNAILYPHISKRFAQEDFNAIHDLGVQTLHEGLGNTLFSYYDDAVYVREDALNHYLDILALYEGHGAYYSPNAYAFPYIDEYYHTPIYNSQLNYFDDLVPLLPTVLSGHVSMYSNFLNFNSLGTNQLLMLIDFNINPAYILSHERSNNLNNTDIEYLYATTFSMWEDTIASEYRFINEALQHVQGAKVVSRTVINAGISQVSYDNGVTIIVNYTANSYYLGDNLWVNPQGYIIKEAS